MNRRRFLQFSAALVGSPLLDRAVFAAAADEKLPVTGRDEPALAGFDRMMLGFMEKNEIPGAAMAIGRGGRIVYARGFGYADVAKKEPVQPDALFRIASLSKSFTAVAILQLQETGKLKLSEPAFKILGYKPHLENGASVDPRLWQITIAQLLHHTGGFDRDAKESFDPMFQSFRIAEAMGTKPPAEPRQIIEYMMGRKLDFDPGMREAYSNFGYCVLGRIIEKLSGTPVYATYVEREVLKPLGIHRMRIGRSLEKDRAPGEVRYYPRNDERVNSVFGGGKRVPMAYGGWYLESLDSHGGWIASAPELVRYASAFDHPDSCPVLKRASVEELFRRPKDTGFTADGKPRDAYYACGWEVRPMGHGTMNTWHTGLLDGTSTLLVRRCDGLTWAVLFNKDYDAKGKALCGDVDPLVHPMADDVKTWPKGWEFEDNAIKG
ncbi:MAG TPA: serine hydrolase domain-containing protein [Tepidisphaeraceae bacterium]|nr:serine hydrolase domain-containing protein [Tepidisphaeraceae bacterium]